MTNLSVDLDSLARDMGETLDMTQFAIKAAKSSQSEFDRPPNFSRALLECVAVGAVCEFILDTLPANDVHNRDRFMALRSDSEKLVKRFWANFNLDNINWKDDPEVPELPVPTRDKRPRVTNEERGQIESYILEKYNGSLNRAQMEKVADHFKRSISVIQKIYYRQS